MAKNTHKHILKFIIVSVSMLIIFVPGCTTLPTTLISATPSPTLTDINQNQLTKVVLPTKTKENLSEPSLLPQSNVKGGIPLNVVHMINELQGWAISQALVMYTEDGGKSWADITPKEIRTIFSSLPSQSRSAFTPIGMFLDSQKAWLAVPQTDKIALIRTEDSGHNWQTANLTINQTQGTYPVQIVSLTFLNSQIGWLLLSMGKSAGQENVELYQTKDSGANWDLISDNDQNSSSGKIIGDGIKSGVGFRDTSEGWLTGSTHGNAVFLYHTIDRGTSWNLQPLHLPEGFTATGGSATSYPPTFFDDQRGVMPVYLASSTPGINLFFYLTTDGGANWIATSPVISQTNRFIWYWVDATHGFVCENETNIFYTTNDAGKSWIKGNSGDLQFRGLDFISPSIGWAISGGSLYQTLDSGHQWAQVFPDKLR